MAVQPGYRDYNPAPGPQQPDKYPAPVGSNYQQYGEQQGYVYDPYQDTYFPDPKASQDYYTESGLVEEEKKPGIGDTILPIAGAAGAIAGGQLIANPEKWGAAWDAIKAPFSMGGGASAPAGAATGAGAQAAAAGGASSVPFGMGAEATTQALYEGATAPFSMEAAAPGWLGAGGTLATAGGIAAGAATGYEQLKGVSSALQGDDLSFTEQAALALPTFGASFLVNPINKMFGSSKGKEQLSRDEVRKMLKERGIIDDKYRIQNADGSTFDIGKDGGEPLYNLDLTDPNKVAMIPAADALTAILTGGNKKLTSDFTGYFVNAATSSGDPAQNLMSYYQKLGLDHDTAYGMIHEMSQPDENGKAKLDKETVDAYKNSLDSFFGVGAYSNGAKPSPKPAPAPSVAAPKPSPVAPPVKPPMQTTTAAPKPQAIAPAPRPAPAAPQPQKPMNTAAKPVRGNIFQRNK